MGTLDKADVGIFTFFASEHPTDLCGTNGLPLTPNSIVIMGEFQALKKLHHRNVCQYLEVFRAKHERIIVAEEHYQESIARCIRENKKLSLKEIRQIAFDVLHGLAFLNSHGVVHRNLSPENVLIDPKGSGKLSKSGIYYMTRSGTLVTFPVGSPKYMAPEVLAAGPGLSPIYGPSGFKVDVWSLGMIITELILGGVLWPDIPERSETKKIFERIFNLVKKSKETHEHPLNLLMGDHNAIAKLQEVPLEMIALLKKCLTVSPAERPEPADLLNHEFFDTIRKDAIHLKNGFHPFPAMYRSRDLDLEQLKKQVMEDNDEVEDLLAERPLREVYYLWTLAGGDLQGELKKRGLLKAKAPVLTLPHVQLHGGDGLGMEKDKIMLFDDTTITASLSQLRERLKHVDESVYFPLIEDDSSTPNPIMLDTAELPIVIREKTVDYQFHRVVLFQRLLEGYPYTKDRIVREARTDIPPLVRGKVWAALLNVQGDVQSTYDNIDKESTTPTDRQIEVDIPRCHQYDEILSSPTGHSKFKRVLKAWVVSHPNLVYWQGLDSLCAPFLSLHFIDEALAYACLASFVPKYLHNFFLKDNSPVIQEYLAVFSHLIAFHDPELFNHLHEIGFIPELYAIPWFLTMYTHVFPLHKIYHLWDTLLLGNSSFPLCIGVAILQQLRDQLLSFGFNECILLFSDMPGIDIERVVRDSKKIFCSTPRTVTVRRHDKPREKFDSKPEKEFLPIGQLKEEICPRITAQDLVHVCELNKSGPLPKRKVKPRGLVLDIRPTQEFNCGQVTDSVNLPYNQAFLEDGGLVSSPATTTLLSFKGRVIVVLGSRSSNPSGFAAKLVKQAFPKVCVLEEQGITKLRNIGILTVPT